MILKACCRGLPMLVLLASPVAAGELTIPVTGTARSADAETFTLPAEVSAALAAAAIGETVRVDGFPVAAGVRARLELERYDVYARGARVVVVDAAGRRPVARSRRLHFVGSAAGDPITRVGLSVDAAAGSLRGWIDGPFGELQIRQDGAGYRLESTASAAARGGVELEASCASDQLPLPASLDGLLLRPEPAAATRGGVPTHAATVAVDTDMELLDEKFDNNTAAATDWIADLFVAMNVAYERDVGLRLLQGDTFLRPGSPPYDGDPWDVTGSGASSAHLDEFGSFWAANMGAVDRVFAMLLSGKSSSGFSSSGIAWIDGYCELQSVGGGYSVTQVFTADVAVTNDVRVVGHEIGHNAASPHTHCYSPPVDECYNGQSAQGCFGGTPSCPPGGSGTLMSYCHFGPPAGADCGSNLIEFHPTVVALFDTFIAAHPGCVDLILEPEIFADGFESGDTSGWS